MKNITILMLLLCFLSPNAAIAVQTTNLPAQEITTTVAIQKSKKQKKGRAKGKGIRNKPSLWSALCGLGSIGAVIGSIGASFALSSTGVVIFAVLGLGFSVFAMIYGFKGIRLAKDNPDLKGTQLGAVVGLLLGGLSLLALLAMTLGAIFG